MSQDAADKERRFAAIGRLALGVAHDVNTPIGIAITAISQLQDASRQIADLYRANRIKKSDLEGFLQETKEISDIALNNLQRAAELIRSFQQVAIDQASARPRRFNLKHYLENILLSMRPVIRKTRHTISLTCPDDIEIESYPGAFGQIIANLIANSLKHAFEPEKAGRMDIRVSRADSALILTYSDNGKGIDKAGLDRIYDLFYTSEWGNGGSGLGLHIVHDTVTHILNGEIECASDLNQGVSFRITIPYLLRD